MCLHVENESKPESKHKRIFIDQCFAVSAYVWLHRLAFLLLKSVLLQGVNNATLDLLISVEMSSHMSVTKWYQLAWQKDDVNFILCYSAGQTKFFDKAVTESSVCVNPNFILI